VIRFPEIGPISVAGRSYASVQQLIGERVREQFIGTQVSVTLGELRALQVFVVGDVKSPGSYAVSPMSTITSALALSGGVARQGSLRRIQLKRQGEVVQTLDVYDVLLRGDTRNDIRLQSGDVVFVPPVGTRVTVAGEVNRPAIYEYRGAANVEDVIGLAGGLKPTAYKPGVKIERLERTRTMREAER
jgi:protein involved in polysaccharide export with SLBB domain